ncbi:hypothetical protein KY284_020568 [Solanum tuberosum]|nr:hypothetical protein KY284_020568 [Solanum tuberosum]
MKRNFYANSAAAYMDYIEHRVVEKLGLEYVKGKELYNIRLSDRLQPNSTDEQINGIKDLIGSAILDSEVQGSLRWPIGKDSSDRFDFKSSTGEKQTMDEDLMFEMLENNLKLIWDLCLLDGSSS